MTRKDLIRKLGKLTKSNKEKLLFSYEGKVPIAEGEAAQIRKNLLSLEKDPTMYIYTTIEGTFSNSHLVLLDISFGTDI